MDIVPHDTLTWVGIGILVAFALLLALLALQRRHLRQWKRAHKLVTGDYRRVLADLRGANLGDDDRDWLEELAEELRSSLVGFDGEVLLDGADAVHVATMPRPVVEIEYPDRLVMLTLAVEHYTAEEMAEEPGQTFGQGADRQAAEVQA